MSYNICMTKIIFITGTGTDIGKTYVTGILARYLRNKDLDCRYYKPVLSGAVLENGELHPGDCEFVIKSGELNQKPLNSLSYVFEEAVSPHLAAQHIGLKIDKKKIFQDFSNAKSKCDYLLVEGAGGITCPIILEHNETYLMSDLIKDMKANCLLIADGGLGTINSVLLTCEYAKARNIKIIGIIFNNYKYNDLMYEDNIKSVEKLCGIPVVGLVENGKFDIDTRGYKLEDLFSEVE